MSRYQTVKEFGQGLFRGCLFKIVIQQLASKRSDLDIYTALNSPSPSFISFLYIVLLSVLQGKDFGPTSDEFVEVIKTWKRKLEH